MGWLLVSDTEVYDTGICDIQQIKTSYKYYIATNSKLSIHTEYLEEIQVCDMRERGLSGSEKRKREGKISF